MSLDLDLQGQILFLEVIEAVVEGDDFGFVVVGLEYAFGHDSIGFCETNLEVAVLLA